MPEIVYITTTILYSQLSEVGLLPTTANVYLFESCNRKGLMEFEHAELIPQESCLEDYANHAHYT